MTFICVGASHVAKSFTLVQLLRICSFVEELFLADLAWMFHELVLRDHEEAKIKPCPKDMAPTPGVSAPPAWI
jgi:hypothetical protein